MHLSSDYSVYVSEEVDIVILNSEYSVSECVYSASNKWI